MAPAGDAGQRVLCAKRQDELRQLFKDGGALAEAVANRKAEHLQAEVDHFNSGLLRPLRPYLCSSCTAMPPPMDRLQATVRRLWAELACLAGDQNQRGEKTPRAAGSRRKATPVARSKASNDAESSNAGGSNADSSCSDSTSAASEPGSSGAFIQGACATRSRCKGIFRSCCRPTALAVAVMLLLRVLCSTSICSGSSSTCAAADGPPAVRRLACEVRQAATTILWLT